MKILKWFFLTIFLASLILPNLALAKTDLQAVSPDLPEFNTSPKDYPLLEVANATSDLTSYDWRKEVIAKPGEIISFKIYYHNNRPLNTRVAKNTRVRVDFVKPDKPSDLHRPVAYLWAENTKYTNGASYISDSVQVKLTSPQSLSFNESFGVKWYPGNGKDFYGPLEQKPLPFSQNGKEIFSPSGLNIGDVPGCFEYAGFLVFQMKVSQPAPVLGQIKVRKIGPKLDGFEFKISGPVNLAKTTDNSGLAIFSDLPLGTYQISETPRSGFEILTQLPITVTLTSTNPQVEVSIENREVIPPREREVISRERVVEKKVLVKTGPFSKKEAVILAGLFASLLTLSYGFWKKVLVLLK